MKKIFLLFLTVVFFVPVFGQKKLSNSDIKDLLDRHNYYRQEQKVPDIKWSSKLAASAQKWANNLAQKEIFKHSNMGYGENIYMATYSSSPKNVVDAWASEQKYYKGEKIKMGNNYGHYTQIIWASTVYVGCGEAVSKSGKYYWVCVYDPPGNYIGQKPVKNYIKPKK